MRAASVGFLFGLAPSGVYLAANCYQPRGALLPHHFTLTSSLESSAAVYFLLHWPWVCTPQALPGTLLYGARTFLCRFPHRSIVDKRRAKDSNCPADSGRRLKENCARYNQYSTGADSAPSAISLSAASYNKFFRAPLILLARLTAFFMETSGLSSLTISIPCSCLRASSSCASLPETMTTNSPFC